MRGALLAWALAAASLASPLAAQGRPAGIPPATVPPPIVVSSAADRTTVAVGERLTVVYSARVPEGATLKLTALVSPGRPEGQSATTGFVLDFEPVGPPETSKERDGTGLVDVRQTVRLAAFVPGETRVPGPVFAYAAPDGSKAVVRAPDVALNVASRLPEGQSPEQLAPKPSRPVRIPARSPWFWASIAAALLAAIGLVWWFVKRRGRKATAAEEITAPPVPPDAEFEAALAALAARAGSLDGDPRPFYTELTHAAKRFLERHLEEPVLEWTTFETVRRLREKGAEPPREAALPELLSGADRIKFGRVGSTRQEAEEALSGARHLLTWGRVRIAARAAAEKAAAKAAKGSAATPAPRSPARPAAPPPKPVGHGISKNAGASR